MTANTIEIKNEVKNNDRLIDYDVLSDLFP